MVISRPLSFALLGVLIVIARIVCIWASGNLVVNGLTLIAIIGMFAYWYTGGRRIPRIF